VITYDLSAASLPGILRRERLRQGFRQDEVAKLTGALGPYISSLERHKRNPTLRSLERFITALSGELKVEFPKERKVGGKD
jgi:transcriptional regulator with XRE-family HTH domain